MRGCRRTCCWRGRAKPNPKQLYLRHIVRCCSAQCTCEQRRASYQIISDHIRGVSLDLTSPTHALLTHLHVLCMCSDAPVCFPLDRPCMLNLFRVQVYHLSMTTWARPCASIAPPRDGACPQALETWSDPTETVSGPGICRRGSFRFLLLQGLGFEFWTF
jgi:hypothetical protein